MRITRVRLMVHLIMLWGTGALAQEGLRAPWVAQDVPVDPRASAPLFEAAKALNIPLSPQTVVVPHGGGSVPWISVRALHNGETLFLQFIWPDATPNRESFKDGAFSDAVAIQFPMVPDETTSPLMGDALHPVNIWQWKAAWETARLGPWDIERVNLLPQPLRNSPVEDLAAFGFGAIQSQVRQEVRGAGRWQQGRWVVVMARDLTTPDPNYVQFHPGETVLFNVALWDGGSGDRGSQKSVSLTWRALTLLPR